MSFAETPACTRAHDLLLEASLALPDEIFLNEQDEAFLSEHLATCSRCASEKRRLSVLTTSLRRLDTIPVPSGLEERIMQAVEADSAGQATKTEQRAATGGRLRPLLAVAASLLLLALVLPSLMDGNHPSKQHHRSEVAMNNPQPAAPEAVRQSKPQVMQKADPATQQAAPTREPNKLVSPQQQKVKVLIAEETSPVDTSRIASAAPVLSQADDLLLPMEEGEPFGDPVGNLVGF
ncbi:MAG TPA: hypothetical protein V6C99_05995 [Oculatellaceae cyanobacterium]|jgi:hypothetical protein